MVHDISCAGCENVDPSSQLAMFNTPLIGRNRRFFKLKSFAPEDRIQDHEPPASASMVRIMILRDADQTARRFSAEDLPVLRSATTSKETFCPSLRPCIPARSTALMCTKTSLLPSSGWMKPKPKPFGLLN